MDAPARAPEDLYGLPLEEFTPARDALAKELKAAGRKDEAAEVKALRKPTLAAWALNRAARDHPDAVERLRAAGADLRAAQNEALAGDASRLRDAGRALADEVDRVSGLAADALRAAGRPATAAQQEKLAATLRTAAVDDTAGDALARGVLVDDLEATGFSLLSSGSGDLSAPESATGRGEARPSRSADRDTSRSASGAASQSTRSASGVGDSAADGRSGSGEADGRTGDDGGRQGVGTLPGAERREKKPKASKEVLEAVESARRDLRRCEAEAEMAATRAHRRAERAEAAAKRAAEAQREAEEARSAAEDAAGEAEAARRRSADAAEALATAEAALPT
ncbi:MAG: hypothetical protein QOF96_3913 [Actinomycetota bacterium]|nr:hypothetical protein [Actinomycetota bacterium]